jgi:hypothetical protein
MDEQILPFIGQRPSPLALRKSEVGVGLESRIDRSCQQKQNLVEAPDLEIFAPIPRPEIESQLSPTLRTGILLVLPKLWICSCLYILNMILGIIPTLPMPNPQTKN